MPNIGGLILFDDINESYFLFTKNFITLSKIPLGLLGEVTWGAKIKSGFSPIFLMNFIACSHALSDDEKSEAYLEGLFIIFEPNFDE